MLSELRQQGGKGQICEAYIHKNMLWPEIN